METKSKLFYVYSKSMAVAVGFVTGEKFYAMNGYDGKVVYTFIDSEKIREAVEALTKLKKQLSK